MSLPRRRRDAGDDDRRRARLKIRPADAAAAGPQLPVPAVGPHDGPARLAIDLGQHGGRALRRTDGAIAGGTVALRPGRHEGGGRPSQRCRRRLDERGTEAPRSGGRR